MKAGERIRVRVLFGLLGAVPVFLAGWLGWVQVAQAAQINDKHNEPVPLVASTADSQSHRAEKLPAPRGTIVDRRGRPLAMDREVYEVRATITVPRRKDLKVAYMLDFLGRVAEGFASALAADPELADRAEARRQNLQDIARRIDRAFETDKLPAGGAVPKEQRLSRDIAIAREVDALEVIDALRELDQDYNLGDWLQVHFLRCQHRTYAEHEVTYGIVGQHYTKEVQTQDGPQVRELANGLESLTALVPGGDVARFFRRDGRGRSYFLAPLATALKPNVLHTTIDLDLQRFATRELAAEAARAGEGKNKEPLWAAMVLVEIASGDVLAAASWHRGATSGIGLACTPFQSLYEPGSIVKPLVLAYALEAGRLDWNHVYDCAPNSTTYRETIASLGRRAPVRDDHACHDLTPHDIIVNSSNIGACYVGLQLEREQWRDPRPAVAQRTQGQHRDEQEPLVRPVVRSERFPARLPRQQRDLLQLRLRVPGLRDADGAGLPAPVPRCQRRAASVPRRRAGRRVARGAGVRRGGTQVATRGRLLGAAGDDRRGQRHPWRHRQRVGGENEERVGDRFARRDRRQDGHRGQHGLPRRSRPGHGAQRELRRLPTRRVTEVARRVCSAARRWCEFLRWQLCCAAGREVVVASRSAHAIPRARPGTAEHRSRVFSVTW